MQFTNRLARSAPNSIEGNISMSKFIIDKISSLKAVKMFLIVHTGVDVLCLSPDVSEEESEIDHFRVEDWGMEVEESVSFERSCSNEEIGGGGRLSMESRGESNYISWDCGLQSVGSTILSDKLISAAV